MDRLNGRKELLLLSHLRKNARKNLTALSRQTGIPVSTLFERIKRYEGGIIRKHTALIDFSRLGFEIRVNIFLKADKSRRDELKRFLMKEQGVNSVFRINNGYDFLVEGIFRNMKEVTDFTEKLEGYKVKEIKEYYTLEEIKKEGFMSDPEYVDAVGV